MYSYIHLFNKHLLSAYYVSGIIFTLALLLLEYLHMYNTIIDMYKIVCEATEYSS